MKNNLLRLLLVAFCTISTQWACKPTQDSVVAPASQDISVDEARRQYEDWSKPNARGNKKQQNRQPLWHLAKETTFKNGTKVIVTPLLYGYAMRVGLYPGDENKPEKQNLVMQTKLLTYKNKKGDVESYVMTVIPDQDYRAKRKRTDGNDFSGFVIATDLEESKVVEAWHYHKGGAELVSAGQQQADRNGRRQDCMETLVDVYEPITDAEEMALGWGTQACGAIMSGTDLICVGGITYKKTGTRSITLCPAGGSAGSTGGTGSVGGTGSTGGTGDGGGNSPGGGGEYTPAMLTDEGVVGLSPVDNFFYVLENVRSPGVYLTQDEKALVRMYPQLMYKIGPAVEATGQKPDMGELTQMVVLLNRHGDKFTQEERNLIWEYPSLAKKLLIYIDQTGQKPDGSRAFKMSTVDQQKYPKFANFVRSNVRDYVMSKPKILNALKAFSGFSEQKINELLKMGSGPTIVIEQLSHPDFWGQAGYVYGQFDGQISDIIKIDEATLNRYEQANVLWPELETAYFTLLAQTLIHEFSHYGANLTQTIDYTDGLASTPQGGEYTSRFDIAAFGYPNNAGEVMRRKYILKRAP